MATRARVGRAGRTLAALAVAALGVAACTSGGGDGDDVSAFCGLLAGSIDTVGLDAGLDPATLDAMAEVAPTEIRDDLDVIVAASDALSELERSDPDPDQVAEVGELFESEGFAAAAQDIEDFALASCDVEAGDFEVGN